jgi:hypothetical protein
MIERLVPARRAPPGAAALTKSEGVS